jgi:hypothetical protein
LVAGCDGRGGITRRVTPKRTAKPCGPGPPRRWGQALRDVSKSDGGYQARHTEESTEQPLKPLRREGRVAPVEPVVPTRVLSTLRTGPRVQPASGLPCALCLPRDPSIQNSGESRRGNDKARLCPPKRLNSLPRAARRL